MHQHNPKLRGSEILGIGGGRNDDYELQIRIPLVPF